MEWGHQPKFLGEAGGFKGGLVQRGQASVSWIESGGQRE